MANLAKKNNCYVARFRYQGKEYKKSLKTNDQTNANAAMRRVENTLHWLAINHITVPDGVDPGEFIVSGGTLKPQVDIVSAPSLKDVVAEFESNLGHLAESTRYTVGVHLRTLKKKLGDKVDLGIDHIFTRDLNAFLQARLLERSSTTVSKERETVLQLFEWAVVQAYLRDSPAREMIRIKGKKELSPFRTVKEIEDILNRGGLSPEEQLGMWECLYLNPEEIAGLLGTVRSRCASEVSFLLHAIPAYTGMRRGEVMRMGWIDIEFDHDSLIARSKKQSRQVEETKRRIDLHPELKAILLGWRVQRPKGQLVVSDPETFEALSPYQANHLFWQPLRKTSWCLKSGKDWFKLGFHTYRHSFASNLAALCVDQRIIDEWMGHQTEAMRKRYRHLYPKNRRSARDAGWAAELVRGDRGGEGGGRAGEGATFSW